MVTGATWIRLSAIARSRTPICGRSRAADELGFYGVLLPTGSTCEEAWIIAATLVPETQRLRFLVAVRPGIISPTAAARMAATFDRLSGRWLLINVVTGGDPRQLAGDGVFLEHDERYLLTQEFLSVWRRLSSGEPVDFDGLYLRVRGAQLQLLLVQQQVRLLEGQADRWLGAPAKCFERVAGVHRRMDAAGLDAA